MSLHRILPFSLLLTSACVIHVQEDDQSLPIDTTFERVVVDVDAGAVDVAVGEASLVDLHLQWTGRGCPDTDAYVNNGVLYVVGDCRPGLFTGLCSVDAAVTVPAGMPVEIWSGSGDVTVDGMLSATIETGSGEVVVRDVTDDLYAETGSGDVEAQGVGGRADLYTGSGEVLLEDVALGVTVETGSGDVEGKELHGSNFDVETGSGEVDLTVDGTIDDLAVVTGSGDVSLTVPEGAYDLSVDTGSGDVDLTRVMHDPQAEGSLSVETGSGDVFIRGR